MEMVLENDVGGSKSTALPVNIISRKRKFSSTPPTMGPNDVVNIVIHHPDAKVFSPDQVWDCHMSIPPEKDGPYRGAGYNFYIRKNGEVHEMHGFTYQGIHARGSNYKTMGICCEGAYGKEKSMPEAQMKSLVALCCAMFDRFPNLKGDVKKVIKHNQVTGNSTECPGAFFPWSDFITRLAKQLRYGNPYYAVIQGVSPSGSTGVDPGLGTYMITPQDKTWYEVATKLGMTETYLKSINPQITSAKPMMGQIVFFKKTVTTNAKETASNDDNFADSAVETASTIYTQSVLDSNYGEGGGGNANNYKLLNMTNREEAILSTDESRPSLSSIKGLKESKYGNEEAKRRAVKVSGTQSEYEKFKIYVETSSGVATYMFKIDPTQMSETRARILSQLKTNGGYIIVDGGPSSPVIALSGVMLDFDGESERIDFLSYYKSFIENGNYKRIYMYLEGILYSIEILNVNTSSSGQQGAIKSYSMSIMVLNDTIGGTEAVGLVKTTETQFKATISTNIIPDLIEQSGVSGISRIGKSTNAKPSAKPIARKV